MVANLIGAALTIACIFFAASLPVSGTGLGRTLRRYALGFFIAALAPSVFVGACRQVAASTGSGGGDVGGASLLGALAVLSVLAYVILKLRARFTRPTRDAWSGQRSAGKRVVDDRDRAGRDDRFPL